MNAPVSVLPLADAVRESVARDRLELALVHLRYSIHHALIEDRSRRDRDGSPEGPWMRGLRDDIAVFEAAHVTRVANDNPRELPDDTAAAVKHLENLFGVMP